MRRTGIIVLCILLLLPCACAQETAGIGLLSEHSGGVVPINDEVIRTYLSLPEEESLTFLKEHSYKATNEPHDGQNITFSWEGGEAPYTLFIAKNAEFADAQEWRTEKTKLPVGIFLPETDYWWKVTDAKDNSSEVGTFRTGTGIRLITTRKTPKADGVQNVRDLGGKRTADGKTVHYGLIYRGGLLLFSGSVYRKNTIDDFGLDVLNRLKIRTEIDLRNEADVGGQTVSPLDGCAYERYTFTGYTSIFPDTAWFDERTPDSLRSILGTLAHRENYPVYFHCLIGQDRTGTLAYLILGLLGVEYDDILRDYELTAFSSVGTMDRKAAFTFTGEETISEPAAFEAMHERMLQYGNGDLPSAVGNYLKQVCGITEEQIDAIRSILLTD